jgi:hypothetical protein
VLVVYLLLCLFYKICYAFGVLKQLKCAVFVILIFIMLLLQDLDDVVPVFLKLEAILDICHLFLSLRFYLVLNFYLLFF